MIFLFPRYSAMITKIFFTTCIMVSITQCSQHIGEDELLQKKTRKRFFTVLRTLNNYDDRNYDDYEQFVITKNKKLLKQIDHLAELSEGIYISYLKNQGDYIDFRGNQVRHARHGWNIVFGAGCDNFSMPLGDTIISDFLLQTLQNRYPLKKKEVVESLNNMFDEQHLTDILLQFFEFSEENGRTYDCRQDEQQFPIITYPWISPLRRITKKGATAGCACTLQ